MNFIYTQHNLFMKFFLMSYLIYFSFISLFLYDLLMIWFIMEINNFLFICFLSIKLKNKKIIFLYYLIQALASLMMMLTLIINNFMYMQMDFIMINFFISIMIKLGIPPFHWWIPSVAIYLDWLSLFIFLTIQKIIPLYMISLINLPISLLYFMILMSTFVSTFKMINSMNFKILLSFSSINQTGWMLILIYFKTLFWFSYMMFYTLILLIIIMIFTYFKMSFSFSLNNNFSSMNFNLICLLLIFNLASIPPLTFFIFKWTTIYIFLLNSNLYFIFILMIFNSFILIYVYINLMNLMMYFYSIKIKLFNSPMYVFKFSYSYSFIFFMILSLIFSLIMILI
uniref:NADH-ubiquinone oxidoreductase chain 2 n=1 Tax=Anoplolepis gracilipes TaxID=354296 RepID=A0A346KN63_ANOGC|nr:NADH dehydrogenase subunit 2 [Anoplolepis gracilipes]AXP85354.1 NADH dehydrogenase subunit 2 [Anoplolepis gracilipes]